MTVTDLVRDTCKAATRMVQRGDKITVKSGGKTLFKVVPADDYEVKMTPQQYKAFVKDMNALAKMPLEDNPVLQMRERRRAVWRSCPRNSTEKTEMISALRRGGG